MSGAWILTQRGGLHGSRQVTSSKLVWNLSSGPEGIPPVGPLLCRTAVVADYFVHGINEGVELVLGISLGLGEALHVMGE